MVALAQTSSTPLEGIVTFGPLVLPASAYLVSLLFRKRTRVGVRHVEDGFTTSDHPTSRDRVLCNAFQLQNVRLRQEACPQLPGARAPGSNTASIATSSEDTERQEDDISMQALSAVFSAL